MIRLSIRRPVAVAMTYLAVALLGAFAWRNIPIGLLPDAELPRLTVRADWRGASPETVEAFLTSPLESTIQLVRGVEKITSTSEEASTEIEVQFTRETDMDFARLDLSERLATLEESELPPGVGQVIVEPYRPPEFSEQSGSGYFLIYTFTGPRTLESLREHLNDVVVPELSRIEGVAVVRAFGGRDRVLEIELNREQMAALGVTPAQVRERISSLDLVREAGAVREEQREWTVTIENRAQSVQDVLTTIVNDDGGRIVRVSDVAVVRDTYRDPQGHYRVNGRPAVQMALTKEIGANTVRVADRVKARMVELERRNPANTQFILDDDESEDIRRQLTDLRSRALVSAVVIFMVLMGFLGSVRSAAVVFATIAFSILISLNLIYFLGLSLNLLTLMGLAMGFGLIVDNSIVVLENVYRRWQSGAEPGEAAAEGTGEVVLPILAATATTLIVFVPFVYLQDELRVYYVPLAVVVALTLIASLFVAFSFIPALSGRVLGVGKRSHSPGTSDGTRRAPFYERFYRGLIVRSLAWPWVAVLVAAGALGGSYYLFDRYVTRGVVWGGAWGQETFINIQITLPRGSDLERTDQLAAYFEERLRSIPQVEQFVSQVGESYAGIRVTFPDSLENTAVPVAIKDRLFAYSLGFSGAEVRVYGYGPSFYGGGGGAPNYSIQVLGYNYEEVRDIAENIGTRLSRISRVRDVNTNASGGWFQRERASQFVVSIHRDAVSRYDLSVSDLVAQISAAVQGETRGDVLKMGGDEVALEVKLEGNREVDLVELRETLINTPTGQPIRLAELVTIESRDVLARILREDQQYQRTVAYEFRGPQKLGDLVHDAVIDATEVGPAYTVKKADTWRWSVEERSQIYLVLGVSVLLIYMVTAALFESLLLPLCVLLTVPMALIGVFLIFFYTNANFTREAYIGVIMMGGIVVNNAILLVDHVGRIRRRPGVALPDAILRGTIERVRPILMTTTTTVIGLLPLVLFSDGANANIWNALAFALIGGLLSSTFLVLTVTPALYLLFERPGRKRATVFTPDLAPAGAD